MKCSAYYFAVSGIVFTLIAIAHLLRIIQDWTFQIGPWLIPTTISWIALCGTAFLSIWSFYLLATRDCQ